MSTTIHLATYVQASKPARPLHGVALCSINGEPLEPVAVFRDEGGPLRLLNGPVALGPDIPQINLGAILGGRGLSTLDELQHSELEAAIRQRVEELDAVRVTVAKYHAYPVPARRRGVVIGAVQCVLDGEFVEPLLVVLGRKRCIEVQAVYELKLRSGGVFDLRPHHYGIRIDGPPFTPELRNELFAAVRRAVQEHKS